MVLFPRIGGAYWYVTDFYETFVAIPVKVTERGGLFTYSNKTPALFTVEFELAPPDEAEGDPGYVETYDASRRELYRTQRQAAKVAARLNEALKQKREAGEI